LPRKSNTFNQRRTRTRLFAACGLLAAGGLVPASPARSAADLSGKTVSLDVAAGDLHSVVLTLERQVGVEALVQDGDKPYKPVYVHLDEAALPKALRTIALSAGARVSVNADGVYVFEPLSAAPAVDSPAVEPQWKVNLGGNVPVASPAAPVYENAAPSSPEAAFPPNSLHYNTIVLQHAVPSDILKLMGWDRDYVELEPFKPLDLPNARPVLSATSPGYTPGGQNFGGNYAGSYGGYPSVPIGTGNAGPAGANYAAHRSAEPNSPDQAGQFPGGGFNGGGFNGGGFNGNGGFNGGGNNPFQNGGTNPFQPQPFQPGAGAPGRGAQQGGQLPTGVARIFALQSNNSLLIEATPEGYNQVKQIVKILDVAPRQVQIKVEFVTASVADVDNLGINFDLVPFPGLEVGTQNGSSTISTAATPTFLQYATGNIVAQLFQTLTRTRGKVVQAPLITTTNNVTASIEVNTQIPFFTTTVVQNGGLNGGTQQGTQANFLTLQTGLTVTPRINSDDSVTLNLNPQITDTTGQAAVGGIPPTIQQRVQTLRTVRSGDTMVLGGLVRKQETQSTIRIPLLAELPILGSLFRTRSKQTNDQELLIFVTPTIIGESNDSATANANGGQSVTVTP